MDEHAGSAVVGTLAPSGRYGSRPLASPALGRRPPRGGVRYIGWGARLRAWSPIACEPLARRATSVQKGGESETADLQDDPCMNGPGATLTRCANCGARVAALDGPTHPYMISAPGCWAKFGELQASEMARFGYPPAHGIVVDAYAASHGGDGTQRRDRQSVFIHLMAICAVTEQGLHTARRNALLQRVTAGHPDFPWLVRPPDLPLQDFTELLGAEDAQDYDGRARAWAAAVWAFWAPEQPRIRAALDAAT